MHTAKYTVGLNLYKNRKWNASRTQTNSLIFLMIYKENRFLFVHILFVFYSNIIKINRIQNKFFFFLHNICVCIVYIFYVYIYEYTHIHVYIYLRTFLFLYILNIFICNIN